MSVKIRSYARNLMELANQEGSVDECYREIKNINNELNRNEELAKYIVSAEHSSTDKKRKLQEVFNNELDDESFNNLNEYLNEIENSLGSFIEMYLIEENDEKDNSINPFYIDFGIWLVKYQNASLIISYGSDE